MSSPTLLTSPPRRHHLSPVKPGKANRLRGANPLNRRTSCAAPTSPASPTATKRSLCDENCDPSPSFRPSSSPHKRVKSGLSPALNAVLRSVISSVPVSAAAAAAAAAASAANVNAKQSQKRTFGTLMDVTNTRANMPHAHAHSHAHSKGRAGHGALAEKVSSGRSAFGKPARTILKPVTPKKGSPKALLLKEAASPSRRAAAAAAARVRAPSSPRLGLGLGLSLNSNRHLNRKDLKPAAPVPTFKRVDPPLSSSSSPSSPPSPTSIDSLLSATAAVSHAKVSSLFALPAPRKEESTTAAPLPLIAANIPGSWIFDIYEDSPQETLQNLMEHSTHTLDISDDSDDGGSSAAGELHDLGKENISPARLAELLAIAPPERSNAMRVDVADKLIPQQHRHHQRRAARRDFGACGRREALREMQKDELLAVLPAQAQAQAQQAECDKKEAAAPSLTTDKLPTLASDRFFEFKPAPGTPTVVVVPPPTAAVAADEPDDGAITATAPNSLCGSPRSPASPASPGWAIWESDHEADTEDEVVAAAKVPLPPAELDFDLEQPGFEVDAASLCGSDRE